MPPRKKLRNCKVMITLAPESNRRLRAELAIRYNNRIGSLSIFFEDLLKEYFERRRHQARPIFFKGASNDSGAFVVTPRHRVVLRSLCANAQCGRPFAIGDIAISTAGNYRGRSDKFYHVDCYTDGRGHPIEKVPIRAIGEYPSPP